MRSPRGSSENENNSNLNKKASISSSSSPNSQFQGQQANVFTCWICRFQVEDPVTCANGHLFCRHCVNRWIEPKSYSFMQNTNEQQQLSNGSTPSDAVNGTAAVKKRSCCPTCRIAMGPEDLRPILGAAEEEVLTSESTINNLQLGSEVAHSVVSRAKLRSHRFNVLRDIYESEISLLLREIDNLGDELSRKRGSEFVEAATQTHARMASMEQLHNATDKLETAVKLSIDLKQHNDHLKKKNEDLEMERLSLLREISRSGSATDERSINTTPQKIGGKYVFSTLEKTISDLQKENEQLKRALERQDEYINELKASSEQSPRPEESKQNYIPATGVEFKVYRNSELNNWGNLSSSGKDNRSNTRKLESRVKTVGEIALPSPSPCKQLGKKGFSKSETKRTDLNKDYYTLKGITEVEENSVRRNIKVETPRRNALQSNKQTKRMLFTEEKQPSMYEISQTTSYQIKKQTDFKHGSETEDKRNLNVEQTQEVTRTFSSSTANEEGNVKSNLVKCEAQSKIPRPRSQSPKREPSLLQSTTSDAVEVRRSPRKIQSSSLSSNRQPETCDNNKDKKEQGPLNEAYSFTAGLEGEQKETGNPKGLASNSEFEQKPKHLVAKTANKIAGIQEIADKNEDTICESNSDELTLELDKSISLSSDKSGPCDQSSKSNGSSASEKAKSDEIDDADKSDAFLNDLFCATEKRVESRNTSKLNKSSSSESETFEFRTDVSKDSLLRKNIDTVRTIGSDFTHLRAPETIDKQQSSTNSDHSVLNSLFNLKVQSQEIKAVKEQTSNLRLSPGQRHSAEIYSPKSQSEEISKSTEGQNSLTLSIDTQSLLSNLNQYQSTLSPITSRYNLSVNAKKDEVLENQTKEIVSEFSTDELVLNRNRAASCIEISMKPSLTFSKVKESIVASGSNIEERSSDFLKDIDDTLAEITRLKGQSIHSLAASTSASSSPKSSTKPFQCTDEDSPEDGEMFVVQSHLAQNSTTPKSTTKRTFRQMNLP